MEENVTIEGIIGELILYYNKGMGMFMDHNGIPLAFDIFPENKNEQPTLKPLEQKVIDDYGIDNIIICTITDLYW